MVIKIIIIIDGGACGVGGGYGSCVTIVVIII